MINLATIKALFGSAKLWALLAAAAVVGIALWSAYSSLKESIRLEIHAAIDEKEIQFNGDVSVVNSDILTMNDADLAKLRDANSQNMTSLMRKLLELEKQVREGSLTEEDRRNLASVARYQSVLITFCSAEADPAKCLKQLGVQ